LDDETIDREGGGRRGRPPHAGEGAEYSEVPGMGEDEHGEQPSR
jgi:hypothetical protein